MPDSNSIRLYHGSRYGIPQDSPIRTIESTDSNGAKIYCDFGFGFYMGMEKQSAVEWVVSKANTATVLTLNTTLEYLNSNFALYDFTDDFIGTIEWALFVAYNRRKMFNTLDEVEKFPKTVDKLKYIANHDIIVGPIADDRMFLMFQEFLDQRIDVSMLIKSMCMVKLGTQFLFHTDKVYSYLNRLREENKIPQIPYMQFLKEDSEYQTQTLEDIAEHVSNANNRVNYPPLSIELPLAIRGSGGLASKSPS